LNLELRIGEGVVVADVRAAEAPDDTERAEELGDLGDIVLRRGRRLVEAHAAVRLHEYAIRHDRVKMNVQIQT
jgi:hypothetical protein